MAMKRNLILVAHNLRSTHNVGSLLRTADGLGISTVFLTGYTPYPQGDNDIRLPHLARKLTLQIHKTALGAEESVDWKYIENINEVIADLKSSGYSICVLEQTSRSVPLPKYHPPKQVAIIIGREVEGVEIAVQRQADKILEIPMLGQKESYNVSQAAAMALYHCRFI